MYPILPVKTTRTLNERSIRRDEITGYRPFVPRTAFDSCAERPNNYEETGEKKCVALRFALEQAWLLLVIEWVIVCFNVFFQLFLALPAVGKSAWYHILVPRHVVETA